MRWVYSPFALPLLLTTAAAAAMAIYAWRRRADVSCATALSLLALAAGEYALGYAFEILAADLPVKMFWAKLQYLGLASIPPLFLVFAMQYAGLGHRLSWRALTLLAIVPVTTMVLAATNDAHGLLWPSAQLAYAGGTLLLLLGHGPAFYLFSVFSYICLLLSAGVLTNAILHTQLLYRRQGALLLAGLLLPFFINVGYMVMPVPRLDPTPMVFMVTAVFFAIGIFRYQLLNLMPVARQTIIERVHDGIMVLDGNGRIVDMNPALEEMTGLPASAAIGRQFAQQMVRWPQLVALVSQDGEIETEISQGEGIGHRMYALNVLPMLQQDKRAAGRLLILRDISELKRLQAQMLQTQKMETIGRLAGGVAHDFNNLLTAIKGYAALAKGALPAHDPTREDIEQIIRAADRAGRLTQQLLTFSRRRPIAPEPVSLNEIITGLDRLLHSILGRQIELVMQLAEDLGLIMADTGQIEQILINLVANACDALPDGGTLTLRTANVTIGKDEARWHADASPGEFVLLQTSDSGTGMVEEVQAHIFEPFFTTKEEGKGSGLGLAVTYGIIRQHRGSIQVESAPGQGTTLSIYLPRLTTEEDPAGE